MQTNTHRLNAFPGATLESSASHAPRAMKSASQTKKNYQTEYNTHQVEDSKDTFKSQILEKSYANDASSFTPNLMAKSYSKSIKKKDEFQSEEDESQGFANRAILEKYRAILNDLKE